MPTVHLTDISIKALKAPEQGQTTYWDASLPAFGIRVSQGGTKAWTVVHGETRKRITIGRYPVISLQQARGEAKRVLAEITLGNGGGVGMRFEEALASFLTTHCAVKNKPGTAKETERLLRRHFLPTLKNRVLEDISTRDFTAIVDRALETPSEAKHAFTAGKTFFRWAARRRYIRHSPADGLAAPSKSVARDRVLSDEELVRVYCVARRRGHPFGTIVELLLLTGQRRSEIGSLRQSFVDHSTKVITLPGGLTKNGREHTFPYGELVARALREAMPNGELLFAARRTTERSFCGWSKGKAAFDRECGIDHWTLHDLRRTFSTIQARIGTPPHITERILNHQVGTLTAIAKIYNRYSYLDEMREAMLNYERELLGIFSKEKT
jgi:integrase